ncbi:ATP-binding protein [Tepidiforma flava]
MLRLAGLEMPVVTLPLGASDDRVLGSLDLEAALVHGEKRFAPGLLAEAHSGFLYIDEVNLLDDYLVDLLLDVAASGVNHVERDGLSVTHAAHFVLVGSGNPEEGELRPQLEDRFGLAVHVRTIRDADTRREIVRRRLAFGDDPAGFCAAWHAQDAALAARVCAARDRLPGSNSGRRSSTGSSAWSSRRERPATGERSSSRGQPAPTLRLPAGHRSALATSGQSR